MNKKEGNKIPHNIWEKERMGTGLRFRGCLHTEFEMTKFHQTEKTEL